MTMGNSLDTLVRGTLIGALSVLPSCVSSSHSPASSPSLDPSAITFQISRKGVLPSCRTTGKSFLDANLYVGLYFDRDGFFYESPNNLVLGVYTYSDMVSHIVNPDNRRDPLAMVRVGKTTGPVSLDLSPHGRFTFAPDILSFYTETPVDDIVTVSFSYR